jgi:hypothetical protein
MDENGEVKLAGEAIVALWGTFMSNLASKAALVSGTVGRPRRSSPATGRRSWSTTWTAAPAMGVAAKSGQVIAVAGRPLM